VQTCLAAVWALMLYILKDAGINMITFHRLCLIMLGAPVLLASYFKLAAVTFTFKLSYQNLNNGVKILLAKILYG
jgi:hypothetical protein